MNALSSYTVEDQRRMTRAKNYFAWQARLVLPELGRRVLEIGCGIGNFTGLLADREAVIAVDSNADCIAALKSRWPAVHAFTLDAGSEAIVDLARFQPDSCVFLNVLEHIEDDVGALRSMAGLVRHGGYIVLVCPAFPFAMSPVDIATGHVRRYTKRTMRTALTAAGLEVVDLKYANSLGLICYYAFTSLLRRQPSTGGTMIFYDRVVVPVVHGAERLIRRPPFGQSVVAVARVP